MIAMTLKDELTQAEELLSKKEKLDQQLQSLIKMLEAGGWEAVPGPLKKAIVCTCKSRAPEHALGHSSDCPWWVFSDRAKVE